MQPPTKPLDPAKRARQIRDAIANHKIKPSRILDQTLDILDSIVALEAKKLA